ncbi:hypothetical protein [Dyadobacter jejuensis]|nr:hypothetical protein [Dyadobacter jejuensis]
MRHPLQCIPVFITLIPLLILIKKEAYVIAPYLILLIFLITKLAIDLAMFHLAANRINNIILYNLSLPISYTLLAGMFIYKLDSGVLKRLVATSIVAFAIFSVWDMLNVNPQLEDNHHHAMVPYASTIQCILMLLWILLYFYELMKSMKVPNLFTSTFFWICCGLLLYYSSFVFIAPVLHYTEKWDNPLSIGFAANISYLFEIFYLIMMSIGLMNFQKHNYARH